MDERYSGSRFTREQKTGLVFLLIFAVLAVGLGGLQMRNTIYGPFVLHADTSAQVVSVDENTRLQQIDTDHDGINDYEELNFYTTSPYLPDTDSDGIPDKTEIDRGTDPNCPQGKPCTVLEENVVSSTLSIIEPTYGLDPNNPSPLDVLANSFPAETASTSQNTISAEILNNPAALRALLLKSGAITQERLNAIDDATLLKLAKESMTK